MENLIRRAEQLGSIAILTGGISPERPIALASGEAVFASLKTVTTKLEYIDLTKNNVSELFRLKADVVFLALHGTGGEDGRIQGLLEWLDIPYTGSGVMGSAISMDKYRTKLLWKALNLPTPPFQLLTEMAQITQLPLPLPLAIKPVVEGSSIGISKVTEMAHLAPAWHLARKYSTQVLAESWIEGSEFTLAFLGDLFLPVMQIMPQQGFYDYAAKYQSGDTRYIFDHQLSAQQIKVACTLARTACQTINATDFGRVDMILDQRNQFQLLEINTLPGMTSHSLLPKAAQRIGISFTELIIRMLELAKNSIER